MVRTMRNHPEKIKDIKTVLTEYGLPCPLSYLNKETEINYVTLKLLLIKLGYKLEKESILIRRKALVVR